MHRSEAEYEKDAREKAENVRARQIVENILLSEYAPPSVVIDDKGDILYVHGRTGKYLEPAPGEARMNILDMARRGIKHEIPSGHPQAPPAKTGRVKKPAGADQRRRSEQSI